MRSFENTLLTSSRAVLGAAALASTALAQPPPPAAPATPTPASGPAAPASVPAAPIPAPASVPTAPVPAPATVPADTIPAPTTVPAATSLAPATVPAATIPAPATVPAAAAGTPAAVPLPPPAIATAIDTEIDFGERGAIEYGGSAGLMLAPDFRNVNVAPSVGWFLADNVELTGILSVSNLKAGDHTATMVSALFEPSYNLAIDDTTWGFIGMGIGPAYVTELGGGVAVAPRLGAKFEIGTAGLLSPSLTYEYSTHNVATSGSNDDVALVAVSSALRVNIGYTTIW